jgi:hypothetical protein
VAQSELRSCKSITQIGKVNLFGMNVVSFMYIGGAVYRIDDAAMLARCRKHSQRCPWRGRVTLRDGCKADSKSRERTI